jgi:hypothetical protein
LIPFTAILPPLTVAAPAATTAAATRTTMEKGELVSKWVQGLF